MKLLIVESPNKVKKIKSILGEGWEVAASVGHIRDLPDKEMGLEAPDYVPQYVCTERGKEVTTRLKAQVAKAEDTYLATDPDREGEAIAWHLQQALHLRSYKRVTFDSITADVIRKAIASPRQINLHLVHAQEARRATDRLGGYKVSPKLGSSAGRVQSPATRLVVDRQREIQSFVETKYFGAELTFDGGAWKAQWDTTPFLSAEAEYILDAELAQRAAACRDLRVTSSETKPTRKAPPAPFTTSTLLQAASVSLQYKPAETAQLAQKLFEQGLITYHRTDSQNFSDEALTEIRAFATQQGWPVPDKPRKWKSKESAQEAHEAIRPTHLEEHDAGEDEQQKALYRLIWARAIASQLADAEFSVTSLLLESQPGAQTFAFKATGRTMTAPGWKILTQTDATEDRDENREEAEEDNGTVPMLEVGTAKQAEAGAVLNKKTRPPVRYTQAGLIKELERRGIGRPSTYPAIMHTIMSTTRTRPTPYVMEEKKYLVPTELGCQLVDALVGKIAFIDYNFTRELEDQLDGIAEGKAGYREIVTRFDAQLDADLPKVQPIAARPAQAQADAGIAVCPACGKGTIRKNNKFNFWGCSNYKADKTGCNFSVPGEKFDKTLSDNAVKQLCEKRITALIKGFKKRDGTKFDAKLKLEPASGQYPFNIVPEFDKKAASNGK
jgi:DNA topoisomerase-1